MADWTDYGPAEFDKRRMPKGRRPQPAMQAGLFVLAAEPLPAKPAPVAEELPGQGGLFGDDAQGAESGSAGHVPDPDPEHGAFDVCRKCGQPIVQHWGTGQWVTMSGTANAECYGRKS